MRPAGKLNSAVTAEPPEKIAELAGLDAPEAREAAFFMVEEDGVGTDHPFSGESCPWWSPFIATRIPARRCSGSSSCSTSREQATPAASTPTTKHVRAVAERSRVARVLVNQANCFGTGGGIRQRPRVHADHGRRHLAATHQRQPLLPALPECHRVARVIPHAVPTERATVGRLLRHLRTVNRETS